MAVAAINPVVAVVVLMAELNGLLAIFVSSGGVGRAIELVRPPRRRGENKDPTENSEPGERIGATMKNLRH